MHVSGLQSAHPFPPEPAASPSLSVRAALSVLLDAANLDLPLATQIADSGSGISTFGAEMLNLYRSLGSGNLESAQAAYASFKRMVDSSDQTSAFAPAGLLGSPLFNNLVSQIEPQLHSGNLSNAQSSLDAFLQGLSSGMIANTSGWMPTIPGKPRPPQLRRFSTLKRFQSSWLLRLLGNK